MRSCLVELLLGGEEGEQEVGLLQVWLLQKSDEEIFKRFQLRLKHIQPFASKQLGPGRYDNIASYPSSLPGGQFCILKDAVVLDERGLKAVELVVLPLDAPLEVLPLAPGGHVDPLHLDDEGETGSAVETSSLQSRHRHSPG